MLHGIIVWLLAIDSDRMFDRNSFFQILFTNKSKDIKTTDIWHFRWNSGEFWKILENKFKSNSTESDYILETEHNENQFQWIELNSKSKNSHLLREFKWKVIKTIARSKHMRYEYLNTNSTKVYTHSHTYIIWGHRAMQVWKCIV